MPACKLQAQFGYTVLADFRTHFSGSIFENIVFNQSIIKSAVWLCFHLCLVLHANTDLTELVWATEIMPVAGEYCHIWAFKIKISFSLVWVLEERFVEEATWWDNHYRKDPAHCLCLKLRTTAFNWQADIILIWGRSSSDWNISCFVNK